MVLHPSMFVATQSVLLCKEYNLENNVCVHIQAVQPLALSFYTTPFLIPHPQGKLNCLMFIDDISLDVMNH